MFLTKQQNWNLWSAVDTLIWCWHKKYGGITMRMANLKRFSLRKPYSKLAYSSCKHRSHQNQCVISPGNIGLTNWKHNGLLEWWPRRHDNFHRKPCRNRQVFWLTSDTWTHRQIVSAIHRVSLSPLFLSWLSSMS